MAGVFLNKTIKQEIINRGKRTVPINTAQFERPIEIDTEQFTDWFFDKQAADFIAQNRSNVARLLMLFGSTETEAKKSEYVDDIKTLIKVNLPDELLPFDDLKQPNTNQLHLQNDFIWVLVAGTYEASVPPSVLSKDSKPLAVKGMNYAYYGSHERKQKLELDWDETPDAIKEAVKSYIEICKAHTKREQIDRDLRTLLDECKSVGQFLKAFPEGQHLLPDDVVRKLHEKAAPKKKKTFEFDSDLTHVKHSILINKIGAA